MHSSGPSPSCYPHQIDLEASHGFYGQLDRAIVLEKTMTTLRSSRIVTESRTNLWNLRSPLRFKVSDSTPYSNTLIICSLFYQGTLLGKIDHISLQEQLDLDIPESFVRKEFPGTEERMRKRCGFFAWKEMESDSVAKPKLGKHSGTPDLYNTPS